MDPPHNVISINETELSSNTLPLLKSDKDNDKIVRRQLTNIEYDPYLIPPSKKNTKFLNKNLFFICVSTLSS